MLAAAAEEERAELRGASGTEYQVETPFQWDARPAGAVRIIVSVDDGGLRAFAPLTPSVLAEPRERHRG